VISPGAGGTENGYAYLAAGLRDRGYLAVVMGHKESGPATLRKDVLHGGIHGGLKDMVTDSTLQADRMLDLAAALTWADKQCHHPYKVLLGHSMGSDTVMFEAGARNKLDVQGQGGRVKTASTPTSRSRPLAPDRSSPPIPGATSTSRSTSSPVPAKKPRRRLAMAHSPLRRPPARL
jgi:predicted dienelactone hydrolase